ncbi:AAA family ATPase [Eubacterium ventriosum]|uniref:AAA family ATPase n=1 Tax=Eubacterium ventriosum TaxID=39496 RepID=UPI001C009421|nr:SMC family ATPase [Eubacterium ventriosum]
MRPIKLIISAFGPYAECETIDFEKLGNKGLYLITGDTGAGKTTIFDAITYVLYGKSSGKTRSSSMLRSKYAKPDVPTFVKMEFEYRNKKYVIERNPEYERPKIHGEGTTTQGANATLIYPDKDTPVTGSSNVTVAINELIGLDYEQFTQIAMIAQNDFLKLLLADTDERRKIFSKIFNTYPYEKLQLKLGDEAKRLRRLVDDQNKSISQYIDGIRCSDSFVARQQLEAIKNNKTENGIENTIDFIEELINNDQDLLKVINERIIKTEKALSDVDKKLVEVNRDNSAKKQKLNAEQFIESNKPNLEVLEKRVELCKEEEPVRKELEYKIKEQEQLMPRYDKLFDTEKEYVNELKLIKTKESEFESLCKDIENLNKVLATNKENLQKLKDADAVLVKIENAKTGYDNVKKNLSNIVNQCNDYEGKNHELELLQQRAIKANDSWETKSNECAAVEKTFLNQQAGILAGNLRDGEPCIVCGSTVHPNPFKLMDKQITEKMVEDAKNKVNELKTIATNYSNKAGMQKGIVDTLYESIVENFRNIKEIFKEVLEERAINTVSDIKAWSDEKLVKVEEAISKNNGYYEIAKNNVQVKEQIEKQIPETEEQINNNNNKKDILNSDISNLKIKNRENAILLEQLREKLEFQSRKDAESNLNQLKINLSELENKATQALNSYDKCKKSIDDANATIKTIEEQLKDSKNYDLEQLISESNKLQEEKKAVNNQRNDVSIRIEINTGALENIKTNLNKLVTMEEKYKWVNALAQTANGNINGKSKIALETYVQISYFERIINRANLRFMKMTNGQYELKRSTESDDQRSKTGLELNVIDHYNGTERDVRTLSGGESFKASLSLALGLSDEIHCAAGGIKIDTLFVDEGFGTLDEDSLNSAIEALNTLTEGDRLVGIISHVQELKTRIDRKIIVSKNKVKGSKVAVEI